MLRVRPTKRGCVRRCVMKVFDPKHSRALTKVQERHVQEGSVEGGLTVRSKLSFLHSNDTADLSMEPTPGRSMYSVTFVFAMEKW
jgi:hypothetical protein